MGKNTMIYDKILSNRLIKRAELPYALYLPADYEQSNKTWPILIFLHGSGERGNDLKGISRHGPFKLAKEGQEFPFIMVAPQLDNDDYWGAYTETLNSMLDDLLEDYSVDPNRVYLTGISLGGNGAWLWSLANPTRFAAVVPICGTGLYWYARRLSKTPVWAFHGADDEVIPVKESIDMVEQINRAGGNARLTIYNNIGHNSWDNAYNDPKLYEWILKQKRIIG